MPIRTFGLNSPEFYEAVCEPRERPWIPNGALPTEPMRPTPSSGVSVMAETDDAAAMVFDERRRLEAGRVGACEPLWSEITRFFRKVSRNCRTKSHIAKRRRELVQRNVAFTGSVAHKQHLFGPEAHLDQGRRVNMAVVKTTRRGLLGLKHTTVSGPSSKGTKAAFMLGEKTFKKSGGAAPGLKRAVAMHKANTAPVTR